MTKLSESLKEPDQGHKIPEVDLLNGAARHKHSSSEDLTVIIERSSHWVPINFSQIWDYRDLLYILALRDIKVRYKQTALGAMWALIQPLFTTLIFIIFFGKLADVSSDRIPYSIFVFAGLLPWTFFSNSVIHSGNSLVGNSNLITKVYFPRIIIPTASVAAGLVDWAISFALLIFMMFYYGTKPTTGVLILPIIIILICLLTAGVGLWMSAIIVKYRDMRYALPFIIQLGLFVSGIITPIPENWSWFILINPVAAFIEAFRAACFGMPFNWLHIGAATILTFAVLIFSAYNFRKLERDFADIL